jgi:hypothetical protein
MRPLTVRSNLCRTLLRIVAALAAGLVGAGSAVAEPQTVDVPDAEGNAWQIVIAPDETVALAQQPPRLEAVPVDPDAAEESEPREARPLPLVAEPREIRSEEHGVEIAARADASSSYADIYRSIPFSRAEYDADPSYRHDATMELLTGNPRPPRYYPETMPYGPGAFPLPGYLPFDPYYGRPYRVFPYPAFGYKSRRYPVARHVYGINYNLWHPVPGVFRRF